MSTKLSFFYHTPLNQPKGSYWFSRVPYGKNSLQAITKKWLALVPDGKKIVFNGYNHKNHSWRVTTAVRLFTAGARIDQVKAVTGHYSDRAAQTYNRIRPLQQLVTSSVIQTHLYTEENIPQSLSSSIPISSSILPAIESSSGQVSTSEVINYAIHGTSYSLDVPSSTVSSSSSSTTSSTQPSLAELAGNITSRMLNTNCVINFNFSQ